MGISCNKCGQNLLDSATICASCGANVGMEKPTDSRWSFRPQTGAGESDDVMLNTELNIDKALKAIEAGEFETALLSLNRAIVDADPQQLPECFGLRGYAHLKLGNFEKSETDCTEAISRSHSQGDAQTYAWRAAALGEQNRWPEAFDDLASAHEKEKENPDEYLALMESYIDAASEYYREIIKSKNESAQTFFDRGWVYFRAGKKDKASRDFRLALELDPQHGRSALGLAGLSLEAGEFEETLQFCETAIAADPSCEKDLLPVKIKANHELGNRKRAVKDLRRLKKLNEGNSDQILEIAKLRIDLGENVRAISDLTSILKADPHCTTALVLRADAYRAIQNYALAIRDYTKYLRQFPEAISPRINRGRAFLADNQIEPAMADFDRALELNNLCSEAFLGRSQALIKSGNMHAALTECQRASRLDNSRAEVFSTLAEIHYSLCEFSNSVEEFSRAIRLAKKKDHQAHYTYRRGNAYYELGDFENAKEDFENATNLNASHAGAWIWTSAVAARTENWPDVVLGLEYAIQANPSAAEQYQKLGKPVAEKAVDFYSRQMQRGAPSAELYRNRGLANFFLGNHSAAVNDFNRSLESQPDNSRTLVQRGRALSELGRHEDAVKDLTEAIRENRDDHRARYYRAASRLALGEANKAAIDAGKAIRLAPDQSRYHLLHGEILHHSRKWKQAIRCLDRAVTTDPTDPAPFRRRASMYSQSGQYLRAISDLTRALELSPNDLEVLAARGNAYNKAEEFELAQQDFEKVLVQDSQNSSAYAGRGFSLAGLGQHDEALIWLTKAIHRFVNNRELSTILFMRGKIFYRMGRYEHAINDFTCTLLLVRDSKMTTAAVLTARAAAYAQNQMWGFAKDDLNRVLDIQPANQSLRKALDWLMSDQRGIRPALFVAPESKVRPIRPPVVRSPIKTASDLKEHEAVAPYDKWIIKTSDNKEYGPVTLHTLDVWLREGRLDIGMQLLRSDWSQWKLVEKIVPWLVETESSISNFPQLDLDLNIPADDHST